MNRITVADRLARLGTVAGGWLFWVAVAVAGGAWLVGSDLAAVALVLAGVLIVVSVVTRVGAAIVRPDGH
jgi:hypothetical protein